MSRLAIWDFVTIGVYFLAVVATGIYAMFKSRRNTVNGYFLAGRFMTWLPVGASLFASNIGSEHFIGLAGSGAASGIAVGAFELNACILLQVLGWVFLPVYIASGVCTLPEYIKKRFGGERIRIYLAVLSLALYILTKVSVNLYSGALFIQQALNWNLYLAVVILLGLTALTTVTGGLAAVIYTDTLQAFVMIVGACLLTILGFKEVGGYSSLYTRYMTAIPGPWSYPGIAAPNSTGVLGQPNTTSAASRLLECGRPRPDSWFMLRGVADPDMPWPGFILGQTPASVWYWCADQMIVQRTLAAKSLSHAQGSTLFAGYLKILPVFILVLPGMISRVLFPDEVACVDPEVCMKVCQNERGCSNIAFPKLVLEIMPTGLKGLMMSVMLAALVSDLTSIFNSASTLFTMDIYRNVRKAATNKELMIVGRVFVGLMVIVGILWIPVIQNMQGAQLFIYIQSISAYLAPPIAAIYLLAILWKRANEKGAFAALMVGLATGSIRMVLNFVYPEPTCGQEDHRPWVVSKLHYMYFAFLLFALTCLVLVAVSLLTEKPSEAQIVKTTYWTRFDDEIEVVEPGIVSEVEVAAHPERNGGLPNGKDDHREAGDATRNGGNELLPKKSTKNMTMTTVSSISDVEVLLEEPTKGKVVCPMRVGEDLDLDRPEGSDAADQPSPGSGRLSRFAVWFCGLGSSDETPFEYRSRIEEIQKLKQTTNEKLLLSIFLLLLLVIDVFFYVFFSTGSDFWLLRPSNSEAVVAANSSSQ